MQPCIHACMNRHKEQSEPPPTLAPCNKQSPSVSTAVDFAVCIPRHCAHARLAIAKASCHDPGLGLPSPRPCPLRPRPGPRLLPASCATCRQNPLYDSDPCLEVRYAPLLWLTRRECEHLRRVLLSLLLGSLIGYERRSPDRPAGIRTMSVTALGACTFTLASAHAFVTGPMAWDSSRISASIPSGCGFL
eukprot:361512-Chlamydomonas_euryale.AAC.3